MYFQFFIFFFIGIILYGLRKGVRRMKFLGEAAYTENSKKRKSFIFVLSICMYIGNGSYPSPMDMLSITWLRFF